MNDEPRDAHENPILERNLENLLRRAYSPVTPRSEFRAALRARVLLSRGFVDERAPRRRVPRLFIAAAVFTFACGFAAVAVHLATREPDAPPSAPDVVPPKIDDATSPPPAVTRAPVIADASSNEISTDAANADAAARLPILRGRVSAYGRPVESFRVSCVRYEKRAGQPDYSVVARDFDGEGSDAGTFELEAPLDGKLRLYVEADDLAVATSESFWALPGDPAKEFTFDLVTGATVRGRVIDAATGEPLRNALVFSENEFAHPAIPWTESALATFSGLPPRGVRSDEHGRFELLHVSPRATVLRAKALGRVPVWRSLEVVDHGVVEDVVFESLAGAGIVGATRDANGAPIEGAVIAAMNQTLGAPVFDYPMAVGYSNDDGTFEIPDLPAGVYSVIDLGRGAKGFDPDRIRIVEVGSSGTIRIDFGPASGDARVEGRLLDASGSPVAKATLSFALTTLTDAAEWRSGLTDADGRFAIEKLDAGRYDVFRVDASQRVLAIGSAELAAGRSTTIELRESGLALSGAVVDAVLGTPLPSAYLLLEWRDPATGELRFAGRAPVEADGSFRLANVRPGIYHVSAVALDGSHGATTADPIRADAGGELRILLPRGGSALVEFTSGEAEAPSLAVLDGAGKDITGLLRIQSHGAKGMRIEGLPVGEVTISIRGEGFEPIAARIRIDEGRETRTTIELTRRR